MTDWLKLFAEKLAASVDAPPKLEFRAGPPRSIVIAEAHPDVGELVIYEDNVDDDEELTVVVGRLFHTHFFPGLAARRSGLVEGGTIADEAAAFVADVLADRLYFADHYEGDQVVGGECGVVGENAPKFAVRPFREAIRPGETASRAYLWSGPIDRLPPPWDGQTPF